MLYPGLAPVRRKPIAPSGYGSTGYKPGPNPQARGSQAQVQGGYGPRADQPQSFPVHPIDNLPPLPTTIVPRSGLVPNQTASEPLQAPAAPAALPRVQAAEYVSKLEIIVDEFRRSEFNITKVFAESVVFVGILMLNWSLNMNKPQRAAALVKVALVVAFFSLHPLYCTVAVIALCVTYAYIRLTHQLKSR